VKQSSMVKIASSFIFSALTFMAVLVTPQPAHADDPVCSSPNLAIPDSGGQNLAGTPVTDTITLTNTDSILDLNITIDTTHNYVGDLVFTLGRHAGPSVTSTAIFSRPLGVRPPEHPTGEPACTGDNIDVTLDDEALFLDIQTDCNEDTDNPDAPLEAYTAKEIYQPNSPLNIFDGEGISATWVLTITDYFEGDTGTLNQWCITANPTLDLQVSKTVTPTVIDALTPQPITYTIRYNNRGTPTATGVVITDVLDSALTNINVISSGAAITATGSTTFTWAVEDLAHGEGGIITVTATISPGLSGGSTLANTATITSTPVETTTLSNNSSQANVTVRTPDLQIIKNDGGVIAKPGGLITYTLTYSNSGGTTSGVVITETVPNNTSFSPNSPAGWQQVGATQQYTYPVGRLDRLAQKVITFVVSIDSNLAATDDKITNTARIGDDGSNGSDQTPVNNTATITTVIPTDLEMTKTVTPTSAKPGQAITYTLIFTNSSAFTATGVLITDSVPISVTNLNVISSGATITQTNTGTVTYTWSLADLGPSAQGIITITGQLTSPLPVNHIFTNTTEISSSTTDLDPGNNKGQAGITVTNAAPTAVDDTASTAEDSATNISVLNNDTDPNSQTLSVTSVSTPTHGSTSTNGTTVTYTPKSNYYGTDHFSYVASDGTLTDTARVTVTITPANDAPIVGQATVLYDGTLGTLPRAQSFTYAATDVTPPSFTIEATQTVDGNTARLDTTPDIEDLAGDSNAATTLNRNTGYSVRFSAQIISENHAGSDKNGDGIADRAGFSVIALSSDTRGIELGFWSNEIWAQEGGSAPDLFTHAEGASFDTTAGLIPYELTILGDTYTLAVTDTLILSGTLRDYSAFSGPIDPYETPNYLFLGDNTSSAQAEMKLGYVSVITNVAPADRSVQSAEPLVIDDIGTIDLDAAGNNVALTLTVGNGTLSVNSSAPNGLGSGNISGNGSGTVTLTGPIGQINATLAYSPAVTYTSDTNFSGTDTLTMTLNDNGHSGSGGAKSNQKTLDITVIANDVTYSLAAENSSVTEGNSGSTPTRFTISRTGATTTETSTVDYALGGSATMGTDYNNVQISGTGITQGGGTITFTTGATRAVISVDVLGDTDIESNETILVTLSNPTNPGPGDATITGANPVSTTITDDDTISLAITKTVEANNPARAGETITYTITVANSGSVDATSVTVTDPLPGGIDGTDLNQTVTVTAGQSVEFTITATVVATQAITITNVASYTHASGNSQDSAKFSVADTSGSGGKIFLPVIFRNSK